MIEKKQNKYNFTLIEYFNKVHAPRQKWATDSEIKRLLSEDYVIRPIQTRRTSLTNSASSTDNKERSFK